MKGYALLWTKQAPTGRMSSRVEACNTADEGVAFSVLESESKDLKQGETVFLVLLVAKGEAPVVQTNITPL